MFYLRYLLAFRMSVCSNYCSHKAVLRCCSNPVCPPFCKYCIGARGRCGDCGLRRCSVHQRICFTCGTDHCLTCTHCNTKHCPSENLLCSICNKPSGKCSDKKNECFQCNKQVCSADHDLVETNKIVCRDHSTKCDRIECNKWTSTKDMKSACTVCSSWFCPDHRPEAGCCLSNTIKRSKEKFAGGEFKGLMIQGKPTSGYGEWTRSSDKYYGEWLDGKKHGQGIYYGQLDKFGNLKAEGTFKDDVFVAGKMKIGNTVWKNNHVSLKREGLKIEGDILFTWDSAVGFYGKGKMEFSN
eukprot:TRINITY_DN6466_c0_g1_i1.p1 TRINITY_DN6466_c0_g1~~TRINITY_DN6466_c0_g1_i1.p1  ORF type:complete len:297 (+),score=20.98 TRINITY_DN6466_c0_g1_i1:188-1078(+)